MKPNTSNMKYVSWFLIGVIHFSCSKSLKEYAIDTALILKLNRDISNGSLSNVHSVLIYKDSALFFEKYWRGKDERHGRSLGIVRHNIYTLHDVRSISKSIVSACIGIAIQKGLIEGVNQPIKTYLPEQ